LADATQLEQVLQNLIGNALKFRGEEPSHVHISAERQGEDWVLMVQDNGIGIDPQDQDSLFEPFRRLHPRHEYPGSGMGLAICAKIVARHGGHMWVESAPDQGATFSFSLPDGQAEGS
jgi:signal transduction histidine kinase